MSQGESALSLFLDGMPLSHIADALRFCPTVQSCRQRLIRSPHHPIVTWSTHHFSPRARHYWRLALLAKMTNPIPFPMQYYTLIYLLYT
jgi:hypothetical protein